MTSRTGAALQDFLRVLHSRNPRLSVLLCDARVQGEGSAEEVARGIERLSRTDVDVIVVTRGGGSKEDLWTFNEERVARAIFACPVPVVSAIGHEIDFTISDFVADWRAPTPSAAAERLAPVLQDLEYGLATWSLRLRKATERRVLELRERLGSLRGRLVDPRRRLSTERLRLSDAEDAMTRVMRQVLRERREALRAHAEHLQRQRPQARLAEQRARLVQLSARLKDAVRADVATRRARAARARLELERISPIARVVELRARLADRKCPAGCPGEGRPGVGTATLPAPGRSAGCHEPPQGHVAGLRGHLPAERRRGGALHLGRAARRAPRYQVRQQRGEDTPGVRGD